VHVAVLVFERWFESAERCGNGFGFVRVDFVLHAIPRERAIHRAGVDVNIAKRLGDQLGIGALAACARAVNGYDNRMLQFLFRSCVSVERSKSQISAALCRDAATITPQTIHHARAGVQMHPESSRQGRGVGRRRVSGRNWETFSSRTPGF
jgi:hypothetical protein